MFGINDNTSRFALLEAKRAKRKALEIENTSVTTILSELDSIDSALLILATSQEEDLTKFNSINNTLSSVNSSIESINTKIAGIESNITNLESEITNLETSISTIQNNIVSINSQISSLTIRITALENK